MPTVASDGQTVGRTVEALIECATGAVNYVVVASGGIAGIDEHLRAVPREAVEFACDRIRLKMRADEFEALDVLKPGKWPASA